LPRDRYPDRVGEFKHLFPDNSSFLPYHLTSLMLARCGKLEHLVSRWLPTADGGERSNDRTIHECGEPKRCSGAYPRIDVTSPHSSHTAAHDPASLYGSGGGEIVDLVGLEVEYKRRISADFQSSALPCHICCFEEVVRTLPLMEQNM